VKYFILILLALIVVSPSVMAMDCPSPGPGFGQHISTMTPDCPKMHGDMFGKMVSSMARGLGCLCPMHAQ
jgi:hypothetical protein